MKDMDNSISHEVQKEKRLEQRYKKAKKQQFDNMIDEEIN